MAAAAAAVLEFFRVEALVPLEDGSRSLGWVSDRFDVREAEAVAWRVALVRGSPSDGRAPFGFGPVFVRDAAIYTERLLAAQAAAILNTGRATA